VESDQLQEKNGRKGEDERKRKRKRKRKKKIAMGSLPQHQHLMLVQFVANPQKVCEFYQ